MTVHYHKRRRVARRGVDERSRVRIEKAQECVTNPGRFFSTNSRLVSRSTIWGPRN